MRKAYEMVKTREKETSRECEGKRNHLRQKIRVLKPELP